MPCGGGAAKIVEGQIRRTTCGFWVGATFGGMGRNRFEETAVIGHS